MAESESAKKKGTNPLVFIGIGCLALIVLIGIGSSIAIKFFGKKIGTGLLQSAIESKTGVKTNISDLEKGKMTFTDTKTGATVDVGTNKIPDTFPKDFPIYPGAKVTSTLSGAEKGQKTGFWLTMTSGDSLEKVTAFYKSELASKGWEIGASYSSGDTSTQTVKKGTYSGSLSISRPSDQQETTIVIVLGEEEASE